MEAGDLMTVFSGCLVKTLLALTNLTLDEEENMS